MADIPPTRASLLVRLRDPRDASAWREFIDLYAPLIYGYLRKQGLQDADAADLSQDVLTAVAGAIDRLEYDPRRGAFRNWLFTVVRRKLLSWRRAESIRPHGGDPALDENFLEQCPSNDQADAEWESEWERSRFAWACDQVRAVVSETTWQAFWRTAMDGQPVKAVAANLGLTVAAIYVARSRVVARLKELIQSVAET
jgi:RNA polymerase sigma-70 factor (ECF subfamily)